MSKSFLKNRHPSDNNLIFCQMTIFMAMEKAMHLIKSQMITPDEQLLNARNNNFATTDSIPITSNLLSRLFFQLPYLLRL